MRLWCVVLMVGCSSPAATPDATPADAAPPPRPGVQDSSGGFIGQTTDAENAYWAAVLAGDDAGRKATLAMLTVDNYDRFLVGASGFMAPKADLTALANGTNPPGFTLDANAKAPLMDGATLADPFYAGFADALLSELDTADRATLLMTGGARNPAATDFTKVVEDLQGNHVDTALTDMTALLAYCNGGPVTDPMAYAARQAAHTLVHRQCFSGPLAPHASPAELLIMADLTALNGDATTAATYYAAAQAAPDYATWPLKPLVERRVAGTQKASVPLTGVIAGVCGSCHTN